MSYFFHFIIPFSLLLCQLSLLTYSPPPSPFEKLPLRGPANLFAITRRNDQIPLPKAIRNPNPGSRPGTNDDLERIVRAGGNREDYVPDEFVLDRPFILDIAYQSGRYVLRANSLLAFHHEARSITRCSLNIIFLVVLKKEICFLLFFITIKHNLSPLQHTNLASCLSNSGFFQ